MGIVEDVVRTEECPCLCRMALAMARLPIALLLAADKARIDLAAMMLVADVEQAQLLQAAGRGEGLAPRQIHTFLTSGNAN